MVVARRAGDTVLDLGVLIGAGEGNRWQAHEVVGYGPAVRAGGEVGDVALKLGQGPDVPAREASAELACWC